MPYTVSGTDIRGVSTVNRKTPELALKKARELIRRGCYDVQIKTPEGRIYHSPEFGDLHARPSRGDLNKSTRLRRSGISSALALTTWDIIGSVIGPEPPLLLVMRVVREVRLEWLGAFEGLCFNSNLPHNGAWQKQKSRSKSSEMLRMTGASWQSLGVQNP